MSVGCVLLVFSTPLAPTVLPPPPLPWGSPKILGGETLQAQHGLAGDRMTWFLLLGQVQWMWASMSVNGYPGHKACLYNNVHILHSSFKE